MDRDLVKLMDQAKQNCIIELAIKDEVKRLIKNNCYTYDAIYALADVTLNRILAYEDGMALLQQKGEDAMFDAIFERIRVCLRFGLSDRNNSMLLLGKHNNVWLFDFELYAIQQATTQSEIYIDAMSTAKLDRLTGAIKSGDYDDDIDWARDEIDIGIDDFAYIRSAIAQREHHTITWCRV